MPQRDVMACVGRFAPSPTGPLHAGSLAAALASWLDVRARGGRWLVRVEDVDTPRCVPGAEQRILAQLAGCGLVPDAPPWRQSGRGASYAAALQRLAGRGQVYPCGCTRREIDEALGPHERHGERVYPGTCRDGLHGKPARAQRVRTHGPGGEDIVVDWHDRRLGAQRQNLTREVGDFVLQRADGLWAYQLAVVVDDAEQGVTDVVRGEDLADNTPRQMHLQRLLGLPSPTHLHVPLVRAADGEKLSKGHGAVAIEPGVAALRQALRALALPVPDDDDVGALLAAAIDGWRRHWPAPRTVA